MCALLVNACGTAPCSHGLAGLPDAARHLATTHIMQDRVVNVAPSEPLADGGSAGGGAVTLASGRELQYDWLVLSLGSAADARGVPGVKEHALPFVSLQDAEALTGRLGALEAAAARSGVPGTVAVVGAGYAGVELAAVVAERLGSRGRVVLLTPGAHILEGAPPGQRAAAEEVRARARRIMQAPGRACGALALLGVRLVRPGRRSWRL